MESEIKDNNKYLLIDDKGMIIEQDEAFNDELTSDLGDIIYRSKLLSNENELLIDIQFEKSHIVISNDKSKKISICSLTNKAG